MNSLMKRILCLCQISQSKSKTKEEREEVQEEKLREIRGTLVKNQRLPWNWKAHLYDQED